MDTAFLLQSALAVFIFMNLMFLLALRLRNNSIVDVGWGLGFILISGLGVALHGQQPVHLLMFAVVTVWGLRLAGYIFLRNWGKGEDFRYAAWRREWGKDVIWRSYLQVFMLQGVIMLVVATPVFAVFSVADTGLSWNAWAGLVLWCIGFFFEAVGDAQMMAFKADPANRGRIMHSGLWRYTRHPNYFGEALLWWGIGFISLTGGLWWLSVMGPALITFLLLKVSGVTMLERKYDGNPKYADYVRTTNPFLPWFPKV